MGHGDAGGNVLREKQLLHRHFLGLELLQQLGHILRNLVKPVGQRQTRRGGDNAVLQQARAGPVRLDEAEADGGNAGIDA